MLISNWEGWDYMIVLNSRLNLILALPHSQWDARTFLPIQALVACQLPCLPPSPSLTDPSNPKQTNKKSLHVIMMSNSIISSTLSPSSVQDLPSHSQRYINVLYKQQASVPGLSSTSPPLGSINIKEKKRFISSIIWIMLKGRWSQN